MKHLWYLSWKNIWFKPLNLLLTLVLFGLGVGLIAFIFITNQQLEDKFNKNLAGIDLVVGAKGSPLQLILSSMYHLDAPTGNIPIAQAKPFLNPRHPLIGTAVPLSLGDSYRTYRIIGTTHAYVDLYAGEVHRGKLWQEDYEVVIGAAVAKKLNLGLDSTFYSSHGFIEDDNLVHGEGHPFKVTGILTETGTALDQVILTNTHSIWGVHAHANANEEKVSTAGSHDGEGEDHHHNDHGSADPDTLIQDLPQTIPHYTNEGILQHPEEAITSLLIKFKARNYQTLNMQRNINENTDLQAATPVLEVTRLFSLMGVGFETLKALGWIIALVSGLSIFISLFSSLKERQYELALLRVMGGTPGRLFLLILLEGILLSLIGALLGLVVCHTAIFFLSGYLEEAYRYRISPWYFAREEWWLLTGALVIGATAALIPAWRAYRLEISQTLSQN